MAWLGYELEPCCSHLVIHGNPEDYVKIQVVTL